MRKAIRADGRPWLVLRRSGRCGAPTRSPASCASTATPRRHRLGQPARQRRRAHRRRLRKLTRHLDLCDLFHIPVLNLVDNPGFRGRLEHEMAGTIRAAASGWSPSRRSRVPIFTVLMRRSFGVAGNNYATPRVEPSVRVAWPAADVGGIPPEGWHRGGLQAPARRGRGSRRAARRDQRPHRKRPGPHRPAIEVPDGGDDRSARHPALVCEWVDTAYRIVRQPAGLVPRGLQYRP
jgi:hypothetical protein